MLCRLTQGIRGNEVDIGSWLAWTTRILVSGDDDLLREESEDLGQMRLNVSGFTLR